MVCFYYCADHEKHACPSLSDKVCCLMQIGYKGPRYTRLKDADVCSVKDLLRLLHTNPKRLEEILELKASCKFWDEIVKSAQASNGTFLYLDPRNEQKTSIVLDVKLQLKALIVEPHQYIAVNQLTEQQKVSLPICLQHIRVQKVSLPICLQHIRARAHVLSLGSF
ncbi:putative CALMODULIN-BINDING PROTEIN60 [Helianthus annuus]|uniref:CALMODULIN-BINDING PROTEIN60 n=1 Tax=Helianthus annuus TaxID=4232 RepID=A0A9K3GXG8_HELAN|nr:putative CALMODULIN-BINDING PROTEIN60 [Helianthus annuus]KAJ0436869.1 putative CALMODULIN-BINDING PROTEIN60 [Helianthus annuus]